ncbi:ribosomal protein uS13 [Candidatus Vidania fulgoroideorum]
MIFEGVNILENKKVFIGIRKIFGIGKNNSLEICKVLKIINKDIYDLKIKERKLLYKELKKITTESELKSKIYNNIKRLIDNKSYRGQRHIKYLPSRGQRTRTNAKTRRKKKVYFFIKK